MQRALGPGQGVGIWVRLVAPQRSMLGPRQEPGPPRVYPGLYFLSCSLEVSRRLSN